MLNKIILFSLFCECLTYLTQNSNKLKTVLSWSQVGYNFDGVQYTANSSYERKPVIFLDDLEPSEIFFIQFNNVPIGLEVYKDKVFITVPRRRHGIPSTLNYVKLSPSSALLKPYPDVESRKDFISIYRPRIDSCERLWMVDTGLYEVPNDRRQIQKPAIIIYDLKNNRRILRQELSDDIVVSERTTGGLTSVLVDVTNSCDDAFAYINDLTTFGIIVFSLRTKESWRIDHESFRPDLQSLNFTAAGVVITWRDGLFSLSLAESADGQRRVYYHSLVSTEEYSIDTKFLQNRSLANTVASNIQLVGNRGLNSQSGSHAYDSVTRTMFYANVARDAITCWNINKKMIPENVPVVVRDSEKLAYISDLKINGDELWVLVNKIPRFALSLLNPDETNFYVHRFSRLCFTIHETIEIKKHPNFNREDGWQEPQVFPRGWKGYGGSDPYQPAPLSLVQTRDPNVQIGAGAYRARLLRANIKDLIKGTTCEK